MEPYLRPHAGDVFARHDLAGILTRHPATIEVVETAVQVADSDASVLIRGETGTGKELVAQAIHANSPRRHRPLVTVHCTALPATVLESELFGHVRGAFTGADRDRAGRLASANGGTLFLDEVAEIPPSVQAKLLRFAQFGEIQRVGSDRTETLDVRIVAATHRDLEAMVQSDTFRQDLYFRLRVVELVLPPLRERRSDLPLLVDHFLRAFWKHPGPAPRFTPRAERALLQYAYPGNVRELCNVVERACLLTRSPVLDIDLLPAEIRDAPGLRDSWAPRESRPPPGPASVRDRESPTLPLPTFSRLTADELEAARDAAVSNVERAFLTKLMDACAGNISLASRTSGIHRSYLQRLLTRYDIRSGPASR